MSTNFLLSFMQLPENLTISQEKSKFLQKKTEFRVSIFDITSIKISSSMLKLQRYKIKVKFFQHLSQLPTDLQVTLRTKVIICFEALITAKISLPRNSVVFAH